ncbi:hypothetical protein [Cellulosimicrobium sp. Marseille-Q4280]|uniref:hypothetical protein n=1 Tax=Cellulosimicrobium sp. Marseille-Q4280 TaxID=2937992 RepID=UPI00203FEB58|nr:hypothetical protein [Cellulosimicrobium sp. Marseille-Q4280]
MSGPSAAQRFPAAGGPGLLAAIIRAERGQTPEEAEQEASIVLDLLLIEPTPERVQFLVEPPAQSPQVPSPRRATGLYLDPVREAHL